MSIRVSKRLEKRYKKHRELHNKLKEHAEDILNSEKFQSTREHIQHGSIAVHRHSIDVAKQSLLIAKALHLKVNEKEMVRGALLHDYFLYDWHDAERENFQKWHGFHHPGIALRNANEDYDLTDREKDIIEKHMWPLTLRHVPKYKESWVVTMADKYCSALETLKLRKGAAKEYIEGKRKNRSNIDEASGVEAPEVREPQEAGAGEDE